MNRPTCIITHHAVSAPQHTVEDVDDWHKDRWPGFTSAVYRNKRGKRFHVGYHYVIERDGTLTQTRAEYEEGAHTIGMNLSSIGVCFMGNFDKETPTEAQVTTWKRLYTEIQRRHHIPPENIHPHRRYANKSCHGSLLSNTYFADLVTVVPVKPKPSIKATVLRFGSHLSRRRMSRRERKK